MQCPCMWFLHPMARRSSRASERRGMSAASAVQRSSARAEVSLPCGHVSAVAHAHAAWGRVRRALVTFFDLCTRAPRARGRGRLACGCSRCLDRCVPNAGRSAQTRETFGERVQHKKRKWKKTWSRWHLERLPYRRGRRDFVRPEFIAMLNDAGGPCWSYESRASLLTFVRKKNVGKDGVHRYSRSLMTVRCGNVTPETPRPEVKPESTSHSYLPLLVPAAASCAPDPRHPRTGVSRGHGLLQQVCNLTFLLGACQKIVPLESEEFFFGINTWSLYCE